MWQKTSKSSPLGLDYLHLAAHYVFQYVGAGKVGHSLKNTFYVHISSGFRAKNSVFAQKIEGENLLFCPQRGDFESIFRLFGYFLGQNDPETAILGVIFALYPPTFERVFRCPMFKFAKFELVASLMNESGRRQTAIPTGTQKLGWGRNRIYPCTGGHIALVHFLPPTPCCTEWGQCLATASSDWTIAQNALQHGGDCFFQMKK